MNENKKQGYKVPQVARQLELSVRKVWRLIHGLELGHIRIGRNVRVLQEHIDEFTKRNEVKPYQPTSEAQSFIEKFA